MIFDPLQKEFLCLKIQNTVNTFLRQANHFTQTSTETLSSSKAGSFWNFHHTSGSLAMLITYLFWYDMSQDIQLNITTLLVDDQQDNRELLIY